MQRKKHEISNLRTLLNKVMKLSHFIKKKSVHIWNSSKKRVNILTEKNEFYYIFNGGYQFCMTEKK